MDSRSKAWRAHQVPSPIPRPTRSISQCLRSGFAVTNPRAISIREGRLLLELKDLAPKGDRRMGANPHANGGLLLRELKMPDFRGYAVEVANLAPSRRKQPSVMGKFLRDVMKLNGNPQLPNDGA